VPAGTALKVHIGDLVVTTPGASYDGLDIHGFVSVRAPDVSIKRSIIRGSSVTKGSIGLVENVSPAGVNFTLTDSELAPAFPSVYLDGVMGSNFTLLRDDIHGTVDTVKVFGDNATVEHSWLHNTVYYPRDPNQGGGGTHNDGVQVLKGTNIRIMHNTITGARNSALQITQGVGKVTGLWFDGNWADGGACSVNVSNLPLASMSGITISDNRFGHATRVPNCPIIVTRSTRLTASGNVFDNTSQPAPVRVG
jgi:hypothetical protein